MKKFLCAILTSAFLLTSVTPAFAAGSITVSDGIISEIMTEFGNNMPTNAAQRVLVWKTFKTYMATKGGIDTLIDTLEGKREVPDDLKAIFDRFVSDVQDEYGEYFVFFLKLYKGTTDAARQDALNNFGSTPDSDSEEIVKTPLPLTDEEQVAADALFDAYVSDEVQAIFATHELGVANFLNLITPFSGRFKMTDANNGDFLLADYNVAFVESLADDFDYDRINGVSIDTDADAEIEGYDILNGVVEMFNSLDDETKDNLKIVLANSEIDLYEEGLDEVEDPSIDDNTDDDDDDDNTSSSSGGQGSTRPGGSHGNSSDDGFVIDTPTYNTASPIYRDMDANSWAVPYVMNLSERNIFKGYEDGTFRPDNNISRQEIAVALVRALGYEADAEVAAGTNSGFADDDAIAEWARGYVNIAVEKNLFTGYDDGEFKPTRTISRQELVTVAMRLTNDTTTSTSMSYSDVNDIQAYARDYVGKATNLNIINGYPDNTFRPLNDVTRAEAAKIIYSAMEYYMYLGA